MKIKKGQHKILLQRLFVKDDGQPVQFATDKLVDASTALKKINGCAHPVEENPNLVKFDDKEITFTPGEIVVLKGLFDGREEWPAQDGEAVMELKSLFEGK